MSFKCIMLSSTDDNITPIDKDCPLCTHTIVFNLITSEYTSTLLCTQISFDINISETILQALSNAYERNIYENHDLQY